MAEGRRYSVEVPGVPGGAIELRSPPDTLWGTDDGTGYGLWDASKAMQCSHVYLYHENNYL